MVMHSAALSSHHWMKSPPRTQLCYFRTQLCYFRNMQLVINGETRSLEAATLAALIEALGMAGDRVAVELNRQIVSRAEWPQAALHDGDRLEIVHFVGGG